MLFTFTPMPTTTFSEVFPENTASDRIPLTFFPLIRTSFGHFTENPGPSAALTAKATSIVYSCTGREGDTTSDIHSPPPLPAIPRTPPALLPHPHLLVPLL